MDPVTGATHTIDQAAALGPEVFLAVIVMLFAGLVIYLFSSVVSNNTKALEALAPVVHGVCNDLNDHDRRTSVAVDEIHQMRPVIDRVEARTVEIDGKVTRLLWKGEKAPHGESR